MNNFAVIKTGGKQYIVKTGDILVIDKLYAVEKDRVEFDKVLLYVDKNDSIELGTPYLKKAKVIATVLMQDKGEKIRIARFKAKSRYRKVTGFRAYLTQVKIDKIEI